MNNKILHFFIVAAMVSGISCGAAAQKGLLPKKSKKTDKIPKLLKKENPPPDKISKRSGKLADQRRYSLSAYSRNDTGLTSSVLSDRINEASRAVQKLSAPPAGLDANVLAALQSKALMYEAQDETIGLWEATATTGDLADITPRGYDMAELVTRGDFMLRFPLDDSRLPSSNEPIASDAKAVVFRDNETPEQLIQHADSVRTEDKEFAVSPNADKLDQWTPQQLAALAKGADVFILEGSRSSHSNNSAASAQPDAATSRIVTLSAAIRSANPDCRIFVEVGPRVQNDGNTPKDWMGALARLVIRAPESFDGIYLNILVKSSKDQSSKDQSSNAQPSEDASSGIADLRQMVAWLRPLSGAGN